MTARLTHDGEPRMECRLNCGVSRERALLWCSAADCPAKEPPRDESQGYLEDHYNLWRVSLNFR